MGDFGQNFRHHRRQCSDPMRGGLLTQERMGELIGSALGDRGYSGAAISDWERGKSKIHQDDRAVLLAIIMVFQQNGGLSTITEANSLLLSGNYRPLDAEERRSLFEHLAEAIAEFDENPGLTLKNNAPVVPKISSRRRKQLILLEKVRSFWVEGVLAQSVNEAQMLHIEMINHHEFVDHPWSDHFGPIADQTISLPSNRILEAYLTADRALLILGEPGAGKTMTLISLAAALVDKAVSNPSAPVPVIFDISSWAKQRQGVADWIVEELTAKYQIPRHYGRDWLQDDELVLLLDGFDQLPVTCRVPALRALNSFRETNGLTGVVLCSRKEEYRLANKRLKFSGALELQPLTNTQIDSYLHALGKEKGELQTAVQENPALQTLAQTPLMLNMLSSVYSSGDDAGLAAQDIARMNGDAVERSSLEASYYSQLLSSYIQHMFQQRPSLDHIEKSQAVDLLSWLGRQLNEHNQNLFLIEQLQPSWLKRRKWRWAYMMLSGLFLGISGGFIIWLLWQLLRQTLPQLPAFTSAKLAALLHISQASGEALTIMLGNTLLGLIVGVLLWFIFEHRLRNDNENGTQSRQWHRQVIAAGFVTGSLSLIVITWTSGLLFGLAWCIAEAFMYMAAARYIFGWNYQHEVRPVEALGWSWRHAVNGLALGLVLAFLAEMIESLLYGYNGFARTLLTLALAGFILGGLRGRLIQGKIRPNQGIWLSVRNAGLAAALVSIPLAVLTWVLRDSLYALTIGSLAAVIAASIFGVSVAIKHFILRAMFHWIAGMPWHYAAFLDYAARLTFLRKVGGGYIFMHRLLQDYFADLYGDGS